MSQATEENVIQTTLSTSNTEGKPRNRGRIWIFTYNNPGVSWTQLSHLLSIGEVRKLVGQRERGESGTEHYQGLIQYTNQVSFETLKALDPAIHWERCRNLKASLAYVTKTDTRIDGPWTMGWSIPEQIRTISPGDFRPWQLVAQSLLTGNNEDERNIYWLYERRGGVGKTAFAKWAAINLDTIVLGGRGADIKYGVFKYYKSRGNVQRCIFHFTRSVEGFVSYQALEEVKDGMFFNTKYESEMILFNSPKILCLANFPPDKDKLSLDRWKIGNIQAFGISWEEGK